MNIIKKVPIAITSIRLLLAVILAIGFMYSKLDKFDILFISSLIYISDFIDGRLARKLKATSVLGAKLDVFSDLFYIVSFTLILIGKNILHIKFLICIILEFLVFYITSKFVKFEKDKVFYFDILGKILAVGFYVIPLTSLFISNIAGASTLIKLLEWLCVVTSIIVVIRRLYIVKFIRRMMVNEDLSVEKQ